MKVPWRRIEHWVLSIPVLVGLVALAGIAIRGNRTADVPNLQPPPGVTLPPSTPSTATSDLTGVQLPPVDGSTTVPGVPDAGTSQLGGSVNGPQGPVPGATVRVEHLVDNRARSVDVGTDASGHWGLPNIAGGRYRVFAFLPPTLAQTDPEVFFLGAGEQKNLDLNVDAFTGAPEVAIAIAPDPPNVGQPTNLVVRVTQRAVDGNGVVRGAGVVGASVTFNPSDGWVVTGSPAASPTTGTNENGDATFQIECRKAGANQIQVTVRLSSSPQPLSVVQPVSACIDPRSTSTTTTTAPPGSSTTTSIPAPN